MQSFEKQRKITFFFVFSCILSYCIFSSLISNPYTEYTSQKSINGRHEQWSHPTHYGSQNFWEKLYTNIYILSVFHKWYHFCLLKRNNNTSFHLFSRCAVSLIFSLTSFTRTKNFLFAPLLPSFRGRLHHSPL